MKRFVIGFAMGVSIMYYYLHYGERVQAGAFSWLQGSASKYRGDAHHQAAEEALGESRH